jgi:hypothetical protein
MKIGKILQKTVRQFSFGLCSYNGSRILVDFTEGFGYLQFVVNHGFLRAIADSAASLRHLGNTFTASNTEGQRR